MSTKNIILAIAGLGIVGAAAYYFVYPIFNVVEVNDELPINMGTEPVTGLPIEEPGEEMSSGTDQTSTPIDEPGPVTRGPFAVVETLAHPASGEVYFYEDENERLIRYQDYETINGPNLHVYLAKDKDAKEFIDLGAIKGTKGNINYTIPDGIDIDDYPFVLTWCVPFGVLFNYAELR